ncbi:MAG: hypothetical protein AVDCRST_MAG11-1385, partial [uncultured Gemmatimonadaceae bacterium]
CLPANRHDRPSHFPSRARRDARRPSSRVARSSASPGTTDWRPSVTGSRSPTTARAPPRTSASAWCCGRWTVPPTPSRAWRRRSRSTRVDTRPPAAWLGSMPHAATQQPRASTRSRRTPPWRPCRSARLERGSAFGAAGRSSWSPRRA